MTIAGATSDSKINIMTIFGFQYMECATRAELEEPTGYMARKAVGIWDIW